MPISTKVHDTTSSLRNLVESDGPFVAAIAPAPSEHADASHRFDIVVRDLVSSLDDRWSDDDRVAITAAFDDFGHDSGEAVMVVHAADGTTHTEALGVGVQTRLASVGDHPRLAPLIEARQMTVAHVVVQTDKSGADIVAFDAGRVVDEEEVEVENRHIHRGRFGGWSHRRFQQRAENTWHDNADNVAETALDMIARCGADVVFVVGPTRAQSMVVERLAETPEGPTTVAIEAGEPASAADEIVSAIDGHVAAQTVELLGELREAMAQQRGSNDVSEIDRALDEGRVEMLFVNDGGLVDDERSDAEKRMDEFVSRAIRTDALVRVVPAVADLEQSVAAIFRW